MGGVIFQWNGARSIKHQRAKALDVASKIRMKERGGTSKIVQIEVRITSEHGPWTQSV